MFKSKLTWLSVIAVLICGLFLFAACSSGSNTAEDTAKEDTEKVEEDADKAAGDMDETITKVVDRFKNDYSKLETEAASATGEDAAALKSIADHDLKDIEDAEKHIDEDVTSGKLTKEAADTAKADLDTVKTSLTDLGTKLESAAAGATARAEDLAEGNAFLLKTKDDVDKDVTDLTDMVDNLKTRVESATAEDKDDLMQDESDLETHIDNLEKRVERLTTEGTLTEDEKKAYDDTIGKLKDDLTSVKDSIDKLA